MNAMSPRETERMRARFQRLGEALDQDEIELRRQDARRPPGENILRGVTLSEAMLPGYRRLLENAAFAAAETERALHKADLHDHWRAQPSKRRE
jgi:hypothetical protein